MVGEFCALIRGKHADVQDSYTTRMVLVNAKNQLHACRVLKMAVKTTRRTAAVSQRAWMKQQDRRRRIPWVSLTFHGRHFSFYIIRTVRWLGSQWVACVSYHRKTTPLQFVFVQIVDTEIAVKIIGKLFNMYLCTAQLNLTHFWGKRLYPCCPLDHIINSKEILRNYDKGINKQPLKTEEERLGLDCMPYTEPLGWVLQDPSLGTEVESPRESVHTHSELGKNPQGKYPQMAIFNRGTW